MDLWGYQQLRLLRSLVDFVSVNLFRFAWLMLSYWNFLAVDIRLAFLFLICVRPTEKKIIIALLLTMLLMLT